jgi:hypothetical protein
MKTARPWLLVTGALMTAVLAYLARDVVHDFLILPLAYAAWQLRQLLAGVAQLVQWAVLVIAMGLVMAWQLIPRFGPGGQRRPRLLARHCPVACPFQQLFSLAACSSIRPSGAATG